MSAPDSRGEVTPPAGHHLGGTQGSADNATTEHSGAPPALPEVAGGQGAPGVSRGPVGDGPTGLSGAAGLSAAFRLDLSNEARERLARRVEATEVAGTPEFEVAGLVLWLRRGEEKDVLYIRSAAEDASGDGAADHCWLFDVKARVTAPPGERQLGSDRSDGAETQADGDLVAPACAPEIDSAQGVPAAQQDPGARASPAPAFDAPVSPADAEARGTTRPIGCRVDWLQIAFQLDVSRATRERLVQQAEAAEVAGAAEFEIAGVLLRLKRSRRTSVVHLENADLRAYADETAPGGWFLVVKLRSTYLATHTIEGAIGLARRLAGGFGKIRGERLRRIDLAADFVGFPLHVSDLPRVRSRAVNTTFVPEPKNNDTVRPASRLSRDACQEVTGIAVGAGGNVMARIYDKSSELSAPGREAKRADEETRWRALGWDESNVTRCEFQFRGDVLAEFELRDDCLDRLPGMLDGLWQYGARWVRLIQPGSATRPERCKLDPRWEAVQAVTFTHAAAALPRSRSYRGGISARQAVGSLLTRSAARGELPRLRYTMLDGEIVDAREFAVLASDADAEQFLRQALGGLVASAAQGAASDYADQAILQHGPRRALEVLADQVLARRARFASTDDDPPEAGLACVRGKP